MSPEATPLTPALSVRGQVHVHDLAALAAAGFKAILCNRPDGEAADQPAFAEIRTAAEALGIVAAHQPVVASAITDADAQAFADWIERLPKPVLAYCRSGMRSSTLWKMSVALPHGDGTAPPLPANAP